MAVVEKLRGNLFESRCAALVNPVNCEGVMGAGLAKQFRERFPEMFRQYRKDCQAGLVKVGEAKIYGSGPAVINVPTKNRWREPSELWMIEKGMQSLTRLLKQEGIMSVAVPPLGCGLGGLKWREVEPVIVRRLERAENLRVIIYEP